MSILPKHYEIRINNPVQIAYCADLKTCEQVVQSTYRKIGGAHLRPLNMARGEDKHWLIINTNPVLSDQEVGIVHEIPERVLWDAQNGPHHL